MTALDLTAVCSGGAVRKDVVRRAKATATGKCPSCGGRICLRVDGSLRSHGKATPGVPALYRKCPGTYLLPVEGSVAEVHDEH